MSNLNKEIKSIVERITHIFADFSKCEYNDNICVNTMLFGLHITEIDKIRKYLDIEYINNNKGYIQLMVKPLIKKEYDSEDDFSFEEFYKQA